MPRNQAIDLPGGVLTIPATGAVEASDTYIDMRRMPVRAVTIFGPATLTGTVTVEISGNLNAELPNLVTWQKLQSGGANVEVGADEAVPIDFVGWHGLRVASASAEAAPRIFKVVGIEES